MQNKTLKTKPKRVSRKVYTQRIEKCKEEKAFFSKILHTILLKTFGEGAQMSKIVFIELNDNLKISTNVYG